MTDRTPHPRDIDMRAAMANATAVLPYRARPFAIDAAVTLVVGRAGESKTWLGLVACAGVHGAGGFGAAPLVCTSGRAVYLDVENGERELGRRFLNLGLDPEALIVADGTGLQLPRDIGDVAAIVHHHRANLMVLDSLRRLTAGRRENDSDDMAPVMAALSELARKTGCAVVVIHHRSTSAHAPDVRGSSALTDQADAVFVLEKVQGDPERRSRRRLRCVKMRSDREPPSLWLEFKVKGGFMTMAEAEPYDGEGEDHVPAHEIVADEIRELAAQSAMHEGWLPKDLAEAVGRSQDDKTFKAALKALLDSGEWVDNGRATVARRVRPVTWGNRSGPLGFESTTPSQNGDSGNPESPVNTGDSGSDGSISLGVQHSDGDPGDYPKSDDDPEHEDDVSPEERARADWYLQEYGGEVGR